MAVAFKIAGFISNSSWIRRMFEEGEALRQEFGAENVFDFTLGNPDVDPPEEFYEEFHKLAHDPIVGMHRYMSNAGYHETRRVVAQMLGTASGLPVQAGHVIMTCGAAVPSTWC